MKMMKLRNVVVATCLLLNFVMCLSIENNGSIGEFSSTLKTVVSAPITPVFRITGSNGYYAYAVSYSELRLYNIINPANFWVDFQFHDDGTLRVSDRCVTAQGNTQGSKVLLTLCNSPPTVSQIWKISLADRQILHPSSGLAVSAVSGVSWTEMTLEENVFSSYQTWRLDYFPPVTSARIHGMNEYCLLTSHTNEVWLGICGTAGAMQIWLIYPDGTIRPEQRPNGCLSFKNHVDKTVLVTACGLSPTSERWVLKDNGHLLNEYTNLVLDVVGGNPSLRQIIVYPPSLNPGPNQRWSINRVSFLQS